MIENDKPSLSINLIKTTAVHIFQESDSYDDKKGLHPNTIKRSSGKAVDKILTDYRVTPVDLYVALWGQERLPDITNLVAQGFTKEDIDRNIKAMLGMLVQRDIIANNPALISDQEYRLKLFGRL